MSSSWQIQAQDLTTSTVKVIVEAMSLKADQKVRIQNSPRLHALARRHVLGRDLPIYGFRLRFIGPDQDRTTRMNFVRNLLRSNDAWTLTAPDSPNEVYFNAASKSIQLNTVSMSVVYAEGVAAIALDVVAIEPAPEDQAPTTSDVGLTRGVAQVLIGGCQTIGEDAKVAVAMTLAQEAPRSEQVAVGASMLISDAVPFGDSVLVGEALLITQEAPRSEGRVISNP